MESCSPKWNIIDARNSDLYDVLAFVAFNTTPLERSTRAARARIHFSTYEPKQQAFLDFVLNQYIECGVDELSDEKRFDKAVLTRMFRFARGVALTATLGLLATQVDKLAVSKLLLRCDYDTVA